jgi:hypothetical protein
MADLWRLSNGIGGYTGRWGRRLHRCRLSAASGGRYGLVVPVTVRHYPALMRDW